MYNLISLGGIVILMILCWLCSRNRRNVNFRLIIGGVAFQLVFGMFVFHAPAGRNALWAASVAIDRLIQAGNVGSQFIFGDLAKPVGGKSLGFIFAFQALPIIIFFSSLMALLYYIRVMPLIVRAFAWFFARVMRLSGAESLYAASQIFGGVEVATSIRPYLANMTESELHCLMTAGLATVALNVIVVYISFLGTLFNDIAGHLICASIIGAPSALIAAKLIWPEDARPQTLGHVPPIKMEAGANLTEAIINGATDGVKLIVGIVALLIAFLGLLGLVNSALDLIVGKNLQQLLGYIFWPLCYLMGVHAEDARKVGELLGLRAVATEVPSYAQLAELISSHQIQQRSALIAAYALCGFAHVASVAIYIGGTAALVPHRRSDLAKVAWRSLLAGTLSTLITGAVAGVCYTNQPIFTVQ